MLTAVALAAPAFPVARAQAAPPKTGVSPSDSQAPSGSGTRTAPPDVVVLKSGGMLRGTISELVPDDRVVIVLVTGEVRTIEMAEVEYAGPAAERPRPDYEDDGELDQPADDEEEEELEEEFEQLQPKEPKKRRRSRPRSRRVAPDVPSTEVSFVSDEPGVEVYVRVASGSATVNFTTVNVEAFQPLCTTPCTRQLEPGPYTFGVSKDGSDPVSDGKTVFVDGGSTVHVEHDSYAGMRAAGWITMIGGTAVGLALILTAGNDCDPLEPDCDPYDTGQMVAGAVAVGVGGLVGYLLTFKSDEGHAQVGLGLLPPRRYAGSRRVVGSDLAGILPRGLGVSGSF